VLIVFGEACLLTSDLSELSDGAREDGGALKTADVVVDAVNLDVQEEGSTTPPDADAGPCGAAGLIAYWTFEEGSGNRINDCSVNQLHGLVVGNPTWVGGRRATSKALKFGPGASTYVQVPSSPLLDVTSSFTVVGWVLFDNDGSNSGILSKGDQALNRGYSIERETNGQLSFYMSPDSSAFKVVESQPADSMPSTWIHLAAVFNANTAQSIYVNGRLVANDVGYPSVTPSSFAIDIGRGWGRCCELHGQIDDLRFFARALDANELTSLMKE
jgi:hypothetical protein